MPSLKVETWRFGVHVYVPGLHRTTILKRKSEPCALDLQGRDLAQVYDKFLIVCVALADSLLWMRAAGFSSSR